MIDLVSDFDAKILKATQNIEPAGTRVVTDGNYVIYNKGNLFDINVRRVARENIKGGVKYETVATVYDEHANVQFNVPVKFSQMADWVAHTRYVLQGLGRANGGVDSDAIIAAYKLVGRNKDKINISGALDLTYHLSNDAGEIVVDSGSCDNYVLTRLKNNSDCRYFLTGIEHQIVLRLLKNAAWQQIH